MVHTPCPRDYFQIVGDRVFLREDPIGQFKYACLSHCWGSGGLSFKLMKSDRLDLCHGLPAHNLPETFQDAVQICDRLGIEYLWIDGLCRRTLTTI